VQDIKILCPTGHLGFTPLEKASFLLGCKEHPDFVVADSGSCDIGPYPLGSDLQSSPVAWQRDDLEVILTQCRKLGIPMIIGSSSDTGTNRGVDLYVSLIKDIAKRHALKPFKLAAIYSDVPIAALKERLKQGLVIEGLDGRPNADEDVLNRTDHAVGVMGPEPIQEALRAGADVVICGRSSDCVIFAAPLLNAGLSPAVANYAGKLLECASFCAEPFMGKESVLGRVQSDAVFVTAMHPPQRCTPLSLASHAMYERSSPYREYVAGGYVDMTECQYEQFDERTTRASGAKFVRSDVYKVKLEGAGKVGERRLFIVGIRDPNTIARIDEAVAWAKSKLVERYGDMGQEYMVHYHLYGRNGVMGPLEPAPPVSPHEIGVVVETVCKDAERAEEICALAARNLFFARLPNMKGTAGAAALMADEVLAGHPAYEWTLNHVIAVDDPLELFPIKYETVGAA
jgi:hypothetical protein